MYAPQTFLVALLLMVLSMICWASWPNLLKSIPKWRLEYFYLDFTLGFLLTIILLVGTLGSTNAPGTGFALRLLDAGQREVVCAILAGFLWNVGNVFLLVAIMIAGMAIAFPVTAVPALVLGISMSYMTQPIGNPLWLAGSVIFLVVAANVTAAAYRRLPHRGGSDKPTGKGIGLSLLAGVLIGLFPPFLARAISGSHPLDSYNLTLLFMVGALVATLLCVPTLLALPLIGERGSLGGYLRGKRSWHVMGLLAGAIWCTGTLSNFLAAGLVGVAISMGIGNGAPMVAALWGIFLWKEFEQANRTAKVLIGLSMVLYIMGVVGVTVAYTNR